LIAAKTENKLQISERWLVLALFLFTVLSRIPFQSQYLYHFDSVNMAFGILEFDVLAGAPQFPGYIVYIALAQALNFLIRDPQTTMLLISIIGSGLAVVMLYILGRDMFNQTTGLIAAVFLATSPLFWFYSEIALPHTLDMFTVILAVWLLYKLMIGETRWLWWTAVYLALVGGFRQQTLMFLAPLMILAGYRLGIVRIILAGILIGVTTIAWFAPLMAYSGGIKAYMEGSNAYSSSFFDSTSLLAGAGMTGLIRNVRKLGTYTLYGWALTILPMLYWLPQIPARWRSWLVNRKVWFILLWIAPALAFYVIIHMGQQGLVFVFLPALFLVSAEGLRRLFQMQPARLQVATAVISLVSAGIFIFGPVYPLGENRPEVKLLTYATLRENDLVIGQQVETIKANFDPQNTLLLNAGNWRHLQYYLPEYQFIRTLIGAKWEVDEGQITGVDYGNEPLLPERFGLDTDDEWQVVITDSGLESFSDEPLEKVTLPTGFEMAYLTLQPEEAFVNAGDHYYVVSENTEIQSS
jgi:hypothetical protein